MLAVLRYLKGTANDYWKHQNKYDNLILNPKIFCYYLLIKNHREYKPEKLKETRSI